MDSSTRGIVIVCAEPFDNVPRPRLFNLYRKNPAHAVGYSDGTFGLISAQEYEALDLDGFVTATDWLPPHSRE